jgi:hypothetical protein
VKKKRTKNLYFSLFKASRRAGRKKEACWRYFVQLKAKSIVKNIVVGCSTSRPTKSVNPKITYRHTSDLNCTCNINLETQNLAVLRVPFRCSNFSRCSSNRPCLRSRTSTTCLPHDQVWETCPIYRRRTLPVCLTETRSMLTTLAQETLIISRCRTQLLVRVLAVCKTRHFLTLN